MCLGMAVHEKQIALFPVAETHPHISGKRAGFERIGAS